jgi:hypothetical protein
MTNGTPGRSGKEYTTEIEVPSFLQGMNVEPHTYTQFHRQD